MISSIELQVICKILTSDSPQEIQELCEFDESYYSVYRSQIHYILEHYHDYGNVPDLFTFQSEFPDVTLVKVKESVQYLQDQLRKNKKQIILIETFNKLKDLGSGDVDDAWKYLELQCERVDTLNPSAPMDIVKDAKKRSQQILDFNTKSRIPTGFAEIDKLMYGGLSTVEELLIILARTNTGKAQPLWAPVLTPSGWTTMGQLKVGDAVVGENNDNGKVIQIFPQGKKDYYRVKFDDGTYAECCDDHLWKVLSSKRRERANKTYGIHEVLTTRDIRNNLSEGYSVDISDPVEFDTRFNTNSEVDGYTLGVIIGGKSLEDVCTGASIDFVNQKLIEYGLIGLSHTNMFIPKHYLNAPVQVRKALLAGLADTYGNWSKGKRYSWEFHTSSNQLADDFAELARSLGVKVNVHSEQRLSSTLQGPRIPTNSTRYITCTSTFDPFTASGCDDSEIVHELSVTKRHCKMIQSVEYVGQTECQCILLDNQSHTYLTNGYTVTHNTWVCTKMMESAQKNGFPVLYYSPEMQSSFLGTRFDTWRGHFQNSKLHQGKYNDEYVNYLDSLSLETTSAFIVEDKDIEGGKVSVSTIRTLVQKHGIKLVIIDGLSYMEDDKPSTRDHEKYKNICGDLFRMSKEFGCAIVVAMQANRETKESKDDKGDPFPTLYNAEGSDHPGRIATQAFSLRQVFEKHVLDIRLEKSRNAANQKPVFSYVWDVDNGNCQYLPGGQSDTVSDAITPKVTPNIVTTHHSDDNIAMDEEYDDDDVEF